MSRPVRIISITRVILFFNITPFLPGSLLKIKEELEAIQIDRWDIAKAVFSGIRIRSFSPSQKNWVIDRAVSDKKKGPSVVLFFKSNFREWLGQ